MQKIELRGKPVADNLRSQLEDKVKQAGGVLTLAIVLVGDDAASHVYKNRLVKLAESMGIRTRVELLSDYTDTKEVLAVIGKLNDDKAVTGILPMMPLPRHIDSDAVGRAIAAEKDVDCVNPLNAGLVYMGKIAWAPCTPRAVMETLRYYGVALKGKHVVIIGRSNVVGKPLAALMLSADATVTICHSKTVDLASITLQADILVVAIGSAQFVKADMLKEGAVLVDVGINQVGELLLGDASAEACAKAGAFTPVPGGIGTVSSMMVMQGLLRNAFNNG